MPGRQRSSEKKGQKREREHQGKVSEDWKKANVTPIFRMKDPGKIRPVSLISIPEKLMDEPILETNSTHIEGQGDQISQHAFMKRKSCLTSLKAFYNEMTGLLDKGRPVDVVYLDFKKAFDTLP
ncbi:rna-directed dna polymerase from mobile element jockey- hypothetical protein [Limosa lapponica baueri]|uniref:Reverse transcriptase domain-containing protein n=1 Tax=Limosa lapponica baueri TaxID=1758121 RepID=A0A2I0UBF7_LIMLA|nr:rna-directed dna polymerase from mobile element jockey- hypothetical protein [Limosa lapponica baueri]